MNKKSDKKKEVFLESLTESKGIIAYACEKCGISRQTYYNWMEKDEDFASQVDSINERTLDLVESKLLSAINDGDIAAIIFYLKTRGKKRGYVEKTETEITGNAFEDLMKKLDE